MLLISLMMMAESSVVLTNSDLLRVAKAPFNKSEKMGTQEVLGTHNGNAIIAEYICGDICPSYTTRIIHYDLSVGPECILRGGVVDVQWVPMAAAVGRREFCVPSVLMTKSKDQ